MTSSLVGSEMCIRDRNMAEHAALLQQAADKKEAASKLALRLLELDNDAVSYTHLTLPTICSV
eukprot:9043589-Prorocentrum_lima.AAC.1